MIGRCGICPAPPPLIGRLGKRDSDKRCVLSKAKQLSTLSYKKKEEKKKQSNRPCKILRWQCIKILCHQFAKKNTQHLHLYTFVHLADAFIQSDLQLHSGYTFSLVCLFPRNRTHNLLRHWRNALPLSHTGAHLQFYTLFTRGREQAYISFLPTNILKIQTHSWIRKLMSEQLYERFTQKKCSARVSWIRPNDWETGR